MRGGHCFALEPMGAEKRNKEALRVFYNQGETGTCVGFGNSRAMSILHGYQTLDAYWLYREARKAEGNESEEEGSTVRAAAEVLTGQGLCSQVGTVCSERGIDSSVNPGYGAKGVYWSVDAEEVLRALGRPGAQAVPFCNSWGDEYPDEVWMPVATLAQLLSEEGEAAVYQT
jgi:hypothetical protein